MWRRRYCYNWPVQHDAPLSLIFSCEGHSFFSNNFHIKVWFNKPYYCIVMYTKERRDRETPPYQGKLGAILSLRWCLFVEKCCNSFRRLLFYYALLLVVLWPSKLFINYQMEFKLHKMEGLLKRNAQSGIIHSFKLLMKSTLWGEFHCKNAYTAQAV